ncbi:MAG: recombinase family protein [Clostridia bacterium]|nr:recombinase family protein [Clostridia bacterium]
MKKKTKYNVSGEDNRQIAIYARKSRITNKGDSIGVQFKQSADYAINQMQLPEDYEFAKYEDKGLSGYYSDRPDFQRMLRDIEAGKIKAVACYKLDRISRKTGDLMRLLEYFEKFGVTLLVCSNNINTQISTSKIIIQVLAIIAEFERDTLTERVQDNLMELAKDGRWLGGRAPTGFKSEKLTTGFGKNKTTITYLTGVEDETAIVKKIFEMLLKTRSVCRTATIMSEEYKTKNGAEFTALAVRDIVKNPIYCTADERAYNYFLDKGGNIFGDFTEFTGKNGISVYNRTDQYKIEDDDSTFFNPKFSQVRKNKDISEWIISVGRHEGVIPSDQWIAAQDLLEEIAERYNRPHRKTNALLSGLMYCPVCGRRLNVVPESDRYTNGKPRFKYVCPGYRKKECTFKAVDGVLMDEYLVEKLSNLSKEESEYYNNLFLRRIDDMISADELETEYKTTKKSVERTETAIANQIRNLREADAALRKYSEDDIAELNAELEKLKRELDRIEAARSGNKQVAHDLDGIRKKLLSFAEYAKGATPEELINLITTVVERIYISTEDGKRVCHIFVKGCTKEDYKDLFGTAGYIGNTGVSPIKALLCDSDKDRKLHPYIRRASASQQMRRAHAKAGSRGADRAGEDHAGVRSAV